ncbi:siderophore-interacting protein [Neisseriaceae bacterium ESL0693]|nr:siderophore-interacting protein [Neisseriaceae bacterium ESL0693]
MDTETEKIGLIKHINHEHIDAVNRIGRYFDADNSDEKTIGYQLLDYDAQACYLAKSIHGQKQGSLRIAFKCSGDVEAQILYLSYAAKHQQGQFPLIRNLRRFRCLSKKLVSPHICRLHWSAYEPLGSFPAGYAFYVSLQRHFIAKPEAALDQKQMAVSRYYTLRRSYPATHNQPAQMQMDIYIHGDSYGSQWVKALQEGEVMSTIGEYDEQLNIINVDYPYVLVGDETAYPAIAAFMERLPDHQRRQALLLLFAHDASEISYFDDIDGFKDIRQLLMVYPASDLQPAQQAIWQHVKNHMAKATIWGALEIKRSQVLNQWLSRHTDIAPHQIRLKGYWRQK